MAVNALLQSLMSEVYIQTSRPDMVAETKQAVLASTMKMHGMEFFFRDIYAVRAVFDSSNYIQQLDTIAIPRFRSIAFMRKWNAALDAGINAAPSSSVIQLPPLYNNGIYTGYETATKDLKIIEPSNIFDDFGATKNDVAYQAGTVINIRSSTSLTVMQCGFYQWPNIVESQYASWIAENFKYAIIYDATSSIFASIGQQDNARKYDATPDGHGRGGGLVWSHINNLLISNIVAQGR